MSKKEKPLGDREREGGGEDPRIFIFMWYMWVKSLCSEQEIIA